MNGGHRRLRARLEPGNERRQGSALGPVLHDALMGREREKKRNCVGGALGALKGTERVLGVLGGTGGALKETEKALGH